MTVDYIYWPWYSWWILLIVHLLFLSFSFLLLRECRPNLRECRPNLLMINCYKYDHKYFHQNKERWLLLIQVVFLVLVLVLVVFEAMKAMVSIRPIVVLRIDNLYYKQIGGYLLQVLPVGQNLVIRHTRPIIQMRILWEIQCILIPYMIGRWII